MTATHRNRMLLAFAAQTMQGIHDHYFGSLLPTVSDQEVYSTPTDEHYHSERSCPELDRTFTDGSFPAPEEVYKQQGLEPCKRCCKRK